MTLCSPFCSYVASPPSLRPPADDPVVVAGQHDGVTWRCKACRRFNWPPLNAVVHCRRVIALVLRTAAADLAAAEAAQHSWKVRLSQTLALCGIYNDEALTGKSGADPTGRSPEGDTSSTMSL
jgi:hypothetical protein